MAGRPFCMCSFALPGANRSHFSHFADAGSVGLTCEREEKAVGMQLDGTITNWNGLAYLVSSHSPISHFHSPSISYKRAAPQPSPASLKLSSLEESAGIMGPRGLWSSPSGRTIPPPSPCRGKPARGYVQNGPSSQVYKYHYYTTDTKDHLVAGHISIGVKFHIGRDAMARDETRERTDIAEDSLVVHL